ncbi:hypothetical protein NDU88_008675 [Pleurodeles waltl]|uniref:Uncharacterized protein n=1 Tax=Pleurodeles waltl TaxID=8319 RepID=A0AAV7PST7_PLEWA|nr:hypothetical protein NDU88_008675 [Pleurodeles waltl]
MEQTLDLRMDDLEAQFRQVETLEEQQLELHLKHEELENCSQRNNIRIQGIPKGMEDPDIMSFVVNQLHIIRGDPDPSLPILDRAHRVAGSPRRRDLPPDILTRVHFFIKKKDILQASRKKPVPDGATSLPLGILDVRAPCPFWSIVSPCSTSKRARNRQTHEAKLDIIQHLKNLKASPVPSADSAAST